jgi:uncharacterized membrane protein
MENKRSQPIILIILAIIIGVALYKQIDFQTLKVEKPALSIVYLITLIFCIVAIIRRNKNK